MPPYTGYAPGSVYESHHRAYSHISREVLEHLLQLVTEPVIQNMYTAYKQHTNHDANVRNDAIVFDPRGA